jgi:phosphatidylglycerophosphatase A
MYRFLATIGGLGNVRWAPGTWGSAVGVFLGLLTARWIPLPWSLVLGGAGFLLCGWICTQAVRQLDQPDPSAVILDEVWGMAIVIVVLPQLASSWLSLLCAFALFRAFDTIKPPPLRQLERLPEGWGVMADDLGASLYTLATLWTITSIL